MADPLTLQGEDLHGLEFVLDAPDGPLRVNGHLARARVADSVTDQCGAIIALTLAPVDNEPAEALAQWLASVRAPD